MSGLTGQGFQPGGSAAPSTQVELSISCRNLSDKDAFSKSDPMCLMYTWDIKGKMFYEYGRTEMVKDTLNPDFVKKFVISYFFEESQKLRFEIYDVDSPSQRLESHDFLGRMECTLGEIVGCGSGKIEKPLLAVAGHSSVQTQSKILVRAEEVSSSKEAISMQLRAAGLDKKDFLGKSDPFLLFYRANNDGSYTVVHKTEVIKNTLNPTWKPFSISATSLCNGDHNRTIKVECYDWDSDGSHDLIGEFTTNLAALLQAPSKNTVFEVINPKLKAKKRNYKHSGQLMVMTCKAEVVPSFLDYLYGGMEMNFTVAIDFTASNGNPSQPTSLHYINPHQINQYAAAIQAVGEIIQDYDTDKMFPVLGFGARLPDGTVSHEFPCNFNPNNPYCAGIQGVMQAYYMALQQVQLYGPTNFAPIIQHVSRFASAKRDGSSYFVLLIITDGVITDMPQTINAIINASVLPMSIIIVGVGNAEFDAMDVLDADGKRLGIEGRYAERDIVQFVPFRNFMTGQYTGDMSLLQAALAKSVLAEIPDQVIQYMKHHSIMPKPPAARSLMPGNQPAILTGYGTQQMGSAIGQPVHPQGSASGQYPSIPLHQQVGNTSSYPQGAPGQPPNQSPYQHGGSSQTAPYPASQSMTSFSKGSSMGPAPTVATEQAPNPAGVQAQAPYPGAAQCQPPYPFGSSTQTPYPVGQGQAPYPVGKGQAPNTAVSSGPGQTLYPAPPPTYQSVTQK